VDIEITTTIPAPLETVWSDVSRLDTHVEWMADASRIDFPDGRRSGTGTRMEVETRVGPLRTTDVMEITAWEPLHRIAVHHRGLVTGSGEFVLEPIDSQSTRFTWRESLRLPWFFGGPLGAIVARPLLQAVWRRNLKRLRARF
jgi:uncharacterized protein YndB with AHSA1/START domain